MNNSKKMNNDLNKMNVQMKKKMYQFLNMNNI